MNTWPYPRLCLGLSIGSMYGTLQGTTDELMAVFLSEKLPKIGVFWLKHSQIMGNKEPNSTCFIARFLNHQLGVAMGVMIPSSQQKTSFWHQDGQFDSPFATVKVLQSVCFPIPFRRIIIERHDSGWILQRGPLRGISGWNTPISTVYPFIFGHF